MALDLSSVKESYRQHGGNTPFFTLNGMKAYARVTDVYDGDTLTLVLNVNGSYLKFKCRMMGIDTCEIRSKNIKNKDLAVKARNRLIQIITGKHIDETSKKKDVASTLSNDVYIVWVHCLDFDKYGRALVQCYATEDSTMSFSEMLIDEKLAYKYEGDTKLSEEHQAILLSGL
jgi:endonuclease YncB( thermonuclease family)